ncbi:MAG: hypothetical protein KJP00_01015 [Bacteroidia bacterium]|nr:hypothetical protein [Bacteroidia bacterium]
MKKRMALWGKNSEDQKVLITFELLEQENKVKNFIFPESVITETIYQSIEKDWVHYKEVVLPDNPTELIADLKVTESMVPDGFTVDKFDVIKRAQTEWHFAVLSAKLSSAFNEELDDIKEAIESLTAFERKEWNRLVDFWKKVQDRIHNRDLLREHANHLKNDVNGLFSKLKEKRSEFEKEFKEKSTEMQQFFNEKLDVIEEKVEKDARLQGLFEELKDLQRKFKDAKLTKSHRSQVWKKLDKAFKVVKEKRFGDKGSGYSALERIQKRYNGLIAAINKMKSSVGRDEHEMKFQSRRADSSDGQLEQQIRQAKIMMIEERLNSKKAKLEDMLKTQHELEKKMEKIKERQAHEEKVKAAKEAAKEKVAKEIEANKASMAEKEEELKKAAEQIKAAKETQQKAKVPEETMLSAISAALGESLTDVIDTARAVIDVVGDRIEEKVEEILDRNEEE